MAMGKKRPDDAPLQALKRDLAAKTVGNLYVFYGEEVYLRDHYLDRLRKLVLSEGMEEFNHHVLQARDFSIQKLRDAIDALPFAADRTLVEVTDYDIYRGDSDAMATILSDLPEYVCLVFIYDVIEYKPDNRQKLPKLVKEKGQVVEFARQAQGDLTDWIARRFKALGHDISTDDARYLIFLCGDLMNGLISEIGKIGAYAREVRITRQDIDAVATPQLDAVVFQLTDAIAAGDFDRAFAVLSDLLHMQEAPIKLLSVLGKQLRQLYTAKLAQESRKNARWLMETWGMRNSYPAEKLMTASRRFSLDWCRRAVVRCEETDLAMKSTGADAQELLTQFLLELSLKKVS